MPPREEPYEDVDCRPFFANLLPEGAWRAALCRQLGIAVDDDFGLLGAVGADCAGAVSVHTRADPTARKPRYVKTTEAELRKWVKKPATRPELKGTPGLRLSLAGAQDKLLVHLDGETPYLCENGAPSTVVLKPDIMSVGQDITFSALNELLAMRFAGRLGLPVARAHWFASAYAVDRFDRAPDGKKVRRLHQEDFVQLLGLPAARKYDVGWKDSFDTVTRFATSPVRARVELVDRLLANLVLGNSNAHGKNFALLHAADGTVGLSPAYDLLCTQMYPALSKQWAMPIGAARDFGGLNPRVWSAFSKEMGLGLPFLRARALELASAAEEALDGLLGETLAANGGLGRDVYPARRRSAFFTRFARVVRANAAALAGSFAVR